jgi:AraC-like DNA-binding protein
MKLYLKYDINAVCKKVLEEQLDKLELSHSLMAFGEIEINDTSNAKLKELQANLNGYGIEIVETKKSILVQKTKDAIVEMVHMESNLPVSKISIYLAEKLKFSYGHISNLFSDVTFTSIENFIIIQKIERAKQLITTNELSFAEIAWKLNYSSSAHFSNQFKNATGLTPSAFQRIINKRRNNAKQHIMN